jgi:hypothetical protein
MEAEEGQLGLRPRPRDLALWCQSRREKGGIVPSPFLAPGTALELLPSRALPSAQVPGIVARPEIDRLAETNPEETAGTRIRPVVRSELPRGNLRSLPLGQLESDRGCGGFGQQGPRPAARRFGWSGPDGEEFVPDTSASAGTDNQTELLTITVSGSSRRNVLGAIALEKNDCSFPWRRQPRRTSEEQQQPQRTYRMDHCMKRAHDARRYPYAVTPRGTVFGLTDSFRNGPTHWSR